MADKDVSYSGILNPEKISCPSVCTSLNKKGYTAQKDLKQFLFFGKKIRIKDHLVYNVKKVF